MASVKQATNRFNKYPTPSMEQLLKDLQDLQAQVDALQARVKILDGGS